MKISFIDNVKMKNCSEINKIAILYFQEKLNPEKGEFMKNNKDSSKSNAYSYEYDEIYSDYIKDSKIGPKENGLEELWEQLIGEEELKKRKVKLEERRLKSDYQEDALNILECPMCGCEDVPNVKIDIPLETNKKRLLSIRLLGGQCTNPGCSEKFFFADDLKKVEEVEGLLNTQGKNQNNQKTEYDENEDR